MVLSGYPTTNTTNSAKNYYQAQICVSLRRFLLYFDFSFENKAFCQEPFAFEK